MHDHTGARLARKIPSYRTLPSAGTADGPVEQDGARLGTPAHAGQSAAGRGLVALVLHGVGERHDRSDLRSQALQRVDQAQGGAPLRGRAGLRLPAPRLRRVALQHGLLPWPRVQRTIPSRVAASSVEGCGRITSSSARCSAIISPRSSINATTVGSCEIGCHEDGPSRD